jgi:hypothetical protein
MHDFVLHIYPQDLIENTVWESFLHSANAKSHGCAVRGQARVSAFGVYES